MTEEIVNDGYGQLEALLPFAQRLMKEFRATDADETCDDDEHRERPRRHASSTPRPDHGHVHVDLGLGVARIELVDESIRVETECVGIRAQERTRVDAPRQRVEGVVLECCEVLAAQAREPLGVGGRQPLALARRSKTPSDIEQSVATVAAARRRSSECELDLAFMARDRLDTHFDRIAEPIAAA